MKSLSHVFKTVLLVGVSTSVVQVAYAQNSSIDTERENIIIFSRQGEAQLNQAIPKLEALFKRTNDIKVRDDLITLYLRTNQSAKALSLCESCAPAQFSQNELENLGKAARNEKQYDRAVAFYSQLQKQFPDNPNGWLGGALASTETKNYTAAKNALNVYKKRFGQDNAYLDAESYLLDFTEPDMAKLGRWQRQLEQNPKNLTLMKELYRLASKYNVQPLREKLQSSYPEQFNSKDIMWLEHDKVIISAKNASTITQQEKSFDELTALLAKINPQHPLYQQTLQDRFVVGVRLNKFNEIDDDFQLLQSQPNTPDYLEEAFGDYWMAKGSPHKALTSYQNIEQRASKNKRAVGDALLQKLSLAASDAGEFKLAQKYLEQITSNVYINDYTRTSKITNPSYDSRYFGLARLALWRGNSQLAQQLIDDRVFNKTPGDPWVMLQKSELEKNRRNYNDAKFWAEKASYFLNDNDQQEVRTSLAETALSQNDLPTVSKTIDAMNEEQRQSAQSLIKHYEQARSGKVVGSVGLQHRTSPISYSNESSQDYAIYTPKTANGHDLYVHYLETRSPYDKESLISRRIGVGTELNFYPLQLKMEGGKGIKLNDKAYFSTEANYTLNQHWSFNLNANINGSGTPVKAINKGVYTRDIGFSTTYSYSDIFQAGLGGGVMKFDDGNLRKEANFWLNLNTFKHDRWTLTNNFRVDYSKNKTIDSAEYYNPAKATSLEFGADLSYYQPLNYGLVLNHHLKASVGVYKQAELSREKMWSISYGHNWRIGKRYAISYEVGRKKNIYDGSAEFNNFGNLTFSIYY
ncbi:poly-beta-1,6 N-acetyl-D-glucosamine export porin PgaA [Haemophilus influenzae]|uniref:poly-beta-1,6 N-acetyl-D-glucosamine export porin PgaA n=1 Tax=Haemophilus influenzae TaxID=727 RepID=UPI00066A13AA